MIRVYRIYSTETKKRSGTFPLCDEHKSNYKLMQNCKLEKIAEKSLVGTKCIKCHESPS